ncbi:MAG: YbaK/EbsC family protein [Pseudomonadota bacterium]
MTSPNLPSAPLNREALLAFFDELGFETTTVEHEPLFTVDQSEKLHDQMSGAHTKNLFLKDKKSRYFLVTVDAHAEIDLKSLHRTIGASGRLSFGRPDKLLDYLGVVPGSVTAFGVVNDRDNQVTFVLDAKLVEHEIINCHPLINEATTSIKRDDLLKFAKLAQHEPLILELY